MARRAELALAALVVGALAAACNSGFRDASRRLAAPAESTAAERRDVRRTYWDRAATRPKSEVGWLLRRDGTSVKDGVERSWYASGQLEYERHWRRDQPFGLWRTWFEDGTQRFEHDYVPGEATPMTWWHASGAISSTGMATAGVRDGPWHGDHPGGERAFEGHFVANRRDGFWVFWYPDGSVETSGSYSQGQRAGVWERYAPGERPGDADAQ